MMKHGDIEIMFQTEESLKKDITVFRSFPIGASVSFYFEVENVEVLYKTLKDKVKVIKELSTTWYGMNEFYITDNNGYVLGIAQQKNNE